MPFKLINCLILLATVAASTGCQSIPNTTDNAGVINNVVAYDKQLSSNIVDDIQRLEIKLQEKSSLTETEAVLYALNNNAAFKALLIDLKLAKADLVNAGFTAKS